MTRRVQYALSSLAVVALLGLPEPAQASTITFQLDQNGCSTSCLSSGQSAGTVTLTDGLETNEVQVTIQLNAGFTFANSSGSEALAFNIGSSPIGTDDLSDTTNFSIGSTLTTGTISMPSLGNFDYALTCIDPADNKPPPGCHGGNPANAAGPVTFDVVLTGITVNSFIANSGGYYFASDVLSPNGNTGDVGANTFTSQLPSTPEPATLLLLGSGLLVGAARFRKARR